MTPRSLLVAAWAVALSGCGLVLDADSPGNAGVADSGVVLDGASDARFDVRDDGAVTDGLVGPDATDAGPTVLPIVEIATLGRDGHPNVVWDGAEFIVGLITDEGAGLGHVQLLRLSPGEVRDAPLERITDEPKPRKSVALAAGGGRLAVGWVNLEAGSGSADVTVLGETATCNFGGVAPSGDHADLVLLFEGGQLGGALRQAGGGGVILSWLALGSPLACSFPVDSGSFVSGELKGTTASTGLFVTAGSELWTRMSGSWSSYGALPGAIEEVDVTEVVPNELLLVYVDGSSGSRALATRVITLDPGGYTPGPAYDVVGWTGPDPAVATSSTGAVAAFIQALPSGDRALGLVALDAGGIPVGGPCTIPNVRPFGNDPEIACGAGYCAIVWQEGDSGSGPFVTRITQRPSDPALLCATS